MIETVAIAAGVPMGVGGYISAAGYLFRRRQRATPGVSPYEYHRAHCGEHYVNIHGCRRHNSYENRRLAEGTKFTHDCDACWQDSYQRCIGHPCKSAVLRDQVFILCAALLWLPLLPWKAGTKAEEVTHRKSQPIDRSALISQHIAELEREVLDIP